MKTIAIKTLGCKVNSFESDAVIERFIENNYKLVPFKEQADVYIINTCTVTNSGDSKSRQAIKKAVRTNPDAVIAVMGCYAQLQSEEIAAIDGVDIVIGTKGRNDLVRLVEKNLRDRMPIRNIDNIMRVNDFETLIINRQSHTRAFLKIQEGCNNFCTFCIIPWARGLIRSDTPENIIQNAKNLVANGYLEIVLTGIHTGGYGQDLEEFTFADLLEKIEKEVEGLQRLRISSIEISQIDERVLLILDKSKIVVNHIHIPIQSGSDEILSLMRRKYTVKEFKQKIEEIRRVLPDAAITTDVICGFPGESDAHFEEMIDTIRDVNFSELHVFPYSKRNGTPAARMNNQINGLVKSARVAQLMAISEQQNFEYRKRFKDKIVQVLVEDVKSVDGLFYASGHTQNYIKVDFETKNEILENTIVDVQITNVSNETTHGEFIA